jgi:WD40 repeat protein
VTSVSWSPDGTRIASGSNDATVRVWQVSTGQTVQTLSGGPDGVTTVAWASDASRIASGGADDTVRIWNVGL